MTKRANRNIRKWSVLRKVHWIVLAALAAASCAKQPEVDLPLTLEPSPRPTETEQIVPTPAPPEPTTLVVCLGQEPDSLYLNGSSSRASDLVLEALYDGPYDILGYEVRPVILEKIPDLADGDALIESVTAVAGDTYLNPETLQPDRLEGGKVFMPTGCGSEDCFQKFGGGEVSMDRMVVDFTLRSGVLWSDGEMVGATDSVFAYRLEAHKDTPTLKYLVERTTSYEALDDLHVRWTGIPGFLDTEYQTNFWTPLPEHLLFEVSPKELLESEEAGRRPVGWGPYVIEEWKEGEWILLHKNERYFRADEGLPEFDYLMFRFVDERGEAVLQQLLTGECDILDEALVDEELLAEFKELQQAGMLRLETTPGFLVERLEFNLDPAGPDRQYLLADLKTRKAIAACVDRERIVQEVLLDLGQVAHTFLPSAHPLYQEPSQEVAFDVASAQSLLDEAGWVFPEDSPDGPRVARRVSGLTRGTPLIVHYSTTPGAVNQAVAEHLREDLEQCGIPLEVEFVEPSSFYASWGEGEVFSRRFELAGWAWPVLLSPPCEMFLGSQRPSRENVYGINASGFQSSDYDQACMSVLRGPPGSDAFIEAANTIQQLVADQLPALPLFVRPRLLATSPKLCGVKVDPSSFTALWGIEEYYSSEECGQ